MNARLAHAAATLAFMAAGLLRQDVLLSAQQPPATPSVPANLASLESHLTDIRMLTDKGENAEAYFSPDGKRLFFSSNLHNVKGRDFDLFLLGADGTRLVFASNRNQKTRGDTNIFIARWKP